MCNILSICEMSKAHVCMNADDADGGESSSLMVSPFTWHVCACFGFVCDQCNEWDMFVASLFNKLHFMAVSWAWFKPDFTVRFPPRVVFASFTPFTFFPFRISALVSKWWNQYTLLLVVSARCEHEPRHLNLFYCYTCLSTKRQTVKRKRNSNLGLF